MVANVNGPHFSGGANIAIKCPSHTYDQTVAFYRDTLGLPLIEEEPDGCIFQFGPNRLWIDKVPNLSHADTIAHGLSNAQFNWRPQPGRWSAACISIAETGRVCWPRDAGPGNAVHATCTPESPA